MGEKYKPGFSLVELLVVMSVISTLMAVILPALGSVRRKARTMVSANNQKQMASAVNLFALDNDDQYPPSVATVGFGSNWNWSDPTKLTGNRRRSPILHRSMSAYLRSYIPDADVTYCPSAPCKYKYLQEAWDAGDDWDNPETTFPSDPVGGIYCFYWNYIGYIGGRRVIFKGPRGPASGGSYSKLLVTDYFGYDHWRSPGAYGSCEDFDGANVTPETWLLSSYWSRNRDPSSRVPEIKLQACYTDGHVESYSTTETVPMWVSITSDGTIPYPDGVGPGIFFLPRNAMR
jgi:prepilin-type N-terminal cleavage/methylation domain-containing protein